MDLNDGLARSSSVVMHAGVEIGEAAGTETHHLAGVELVAHSNFESSRDHCYIFPKRMSMGCNLVPIGHLETNSVVTGGSHGIALQHRQLRSGRDKGRNGPELNLIGRESVLRQRR